MRPSLSLTNRQRAVVFDRPWILGVVSAARPACLASVRDNDAPLATLRAVEATILGNAAIGRVHAEFFADPDPTDVITFQHGEILLGAGVLAENAARFGHRPSEEAALCFIHGLLHLAGWDDRTPGEAEDMARLQEQIFKRARRMV
jgi:probable rRNA maturation factor